MRRPRGDTQEKILAFIKQEVREKGYPPSVREICEAVSLKSTSTVHGPFREGGFRAGTRSQHAQQHQRFRHVVHEFELDRKSTRLNSSHSGESRMPSSA